MKNYFSEFGESPKTSAVGLDNAEPTPEQVAWLAGVFDGEGCITFGFQGKRNHPYWGFHITNTNMALLSKAQMIIQMVTGRPINMYKKKVYANGVTTNMDCYTLDIRKIDDVYKLLGLLLPHLTSKKPKSMLVYEYLGRRINEMSVSQKKRGTTEFANLISSNWRGVTTEREALDIIQMKPQSELCSNV